MPHSWLYPPTDLASFRGTLFWFFELFTFEHYFGVPNLWAWTSLKRHNLLKRSSGASNLTLVLVYFWSFTSCYYPVAPAPTIKVPIKQINIKDFNLFWFKSINDWLIIYGFTSRSRIFHLYGDVTIAGEGLQNLGLCSALMAFEQGRIFIVPHLLWHGTSVFPVSSEGPPHLVASYDTRGDVEDLF
jgi:hypothetical protein